MIFAIGSTVTVPVYGSSSVNWDAVYWTFGVFVVLAVIVAIFYLINEIMTLRAKKDWLQKELTAAQAEVNELRKRSDQAIQQTERLNAKLTEVVRARDELASWVNTVIEFCDRYKLKRPMLPDVSETIPAARKPTATQSLRPETHE